MQQPHLTSRGTRLPWPVVALGPDDPPACIQCPDPLELHQPDPGQPARLLGICLSCGLWYLIARPDDAA